MRTIKFRGKRVDNGEWVQGDYLRRAGGVHCIIEMQPNDQGMVEYIVNQAAPDSIGLFSGLLDKNGKEIYEGDVYRFDHPDSINEVSSSMGGGFAVFDLSPAFTNGHILTDIEVIGNIHDNPELLKRWD